MSYARLSGSELLKQSPMKALCRQERDTDETFRDEKDDRIEVVLKP